MADVLRQKLNHRTCETINFIYMADFRGNTLRLPVIPIGREYGGAPHVKDKLSLEDFIEMLWLKVQTATGYQEQIMTV